MAARDILGGPRWQKGERMDWMKKSIMDRFHKLEGIAQPGSKIPPQPKETKAAGQLQQVKTK